MEDIQKIVDRADILLEALPYIRRFSNRTIVIKYGGHAMVDEDLKRNFALDVVMMKYIGMNPVIVHGGGPQIGSYLKKLGKESRFVQGMRVTDQETMDIVEMVLAGKVNKEIVGFINHHGGRAVGLSGKDGSIVLAEKYLLSEERAKDTPPEIIDLGLVGKVKAIQADLIQSLARDGFIPVIAPTGLGERGETFNINADLVAGAVASALRAEKLVLLTDVPGVFDEGKRLINTMDDAEAYRLIAEGVIEGGMYPKVKCCLKALRSGVGKAHIIDGEKRHAILLEVFTDRGSERKSSRRNKRQRKMTTEELIEAGNRYLFSTYRRFPIVLVRGKGARVWDSDGKEYLDFLAGIAVCSLGHSHPRVVRAIQAQAETLTHVSNLYYIEPQIRLAKLLVEHSFADRSSSATAAPRRSRGHQARPEIRSRADGPGPARDHHHGQFLPRKDPGRRHRHGPEEKTRPASSPSRKGSATFPTTTWRPRRPPCPTGPAGSSWNPSRAREASASPRRST
jgi:acetylglutamate kinase